MPCLADWLILESQDNEDILLCQFWLASAVVATDLT